MSGSGHPVAELRFPAVTAYFQNQFGPRGEEEGKESPRQGYAEPQGFCFFTILGALRRNDPVRSRERQKRKEERRGRTEKQYGRPPVAGKGKLITKQEQMGRGYSHTDAHVLVLRLTDSGHQDQVFSKLVKPVYDQISLGSGQRGPRRTKQT